MAPVARLSSFDDDYDGTRPRYESLQAWLKVYGNAEYAAYKHNNASAPLSYEEWVESPHALGLFLWNLTLDIWDEPSDTVSNLKIVF
jgi:hypothetical protein